MFHTSPPYAIRQENEVAEPKTLVEAAYRSLRRNIIEGRLSPGEKLRIEHIKNDYGVGGATLREALSLLTSDALVVSLGLDTFAVDPISTFKLQGDDFSRLGSRLQALGLPTAFILEGGYAAAELGHNAAAVIEGFES